MTQQFKWLAIAGYMIFIACNHPAANPPLMGGITQRESLTEEKSVEEIEAPQGFQRINTTAKSFQKYLKSIELKKDKTVYLYNGRPKSNQFAQYAVLNISVGNKDLQQCADAVMRLRAEYFYNQNKFQLIEFFNGRREKINYRNWLGGKENSRAEFMK